MRNSHFSTVCVQTNIPFGVGRRKLLLAMKTHFPWKTSAAMTLLEVLLVIVATVILIALLLPGNGGSHNKATALRCLNNLRQTDLGFLMYASDNGGKFPMQASVTNGGTREFLSQNQTFPHFEKLSGYVRYLPTLICPRDKNRQPAENYDALGDSNLSYFVNGYPSTNYPTTCILVGDRNLAVNGQPVPHGTLTITTNLDLSWTRELHPNGGTLGFVDGHARFCQNTALNGVMRSYDFSITRLSVP
ncbi:MAG TPA: type II secretion system protein [Verrucomicrobiae bacterium]|nr:type II secretion system protein [Verrucomicrobiae bacterium]